MEKKRICVIEIALGLALMGQKKLAATVESLVKKGAKSRRQSQEFLRDVQSDGAEGKKAIGNQLLKSSKKVIGELGFVTADDIAKVHKEIVGLKTMIRSPRSAKA